MYFFNIFYVMYNLTKELKMSLFNRTKYTTLIRRNIEIVLPTDVYKSIQKKGFSVSVTNSGTVQLLESSTSKYCGTLKSFMKVNGFKNGNTCDFHKSNLIK